MGLWWGAGSERRWRLTAGVEGYLDDCGGPPVKMLIPLEILVR